MPTINGVAIQWAMPDFGITESSVGSLILQSFEHTKVDDPERIKNASGQTCTSVWPDPSQDVSFEYFVKGTGIANAKTQSKVPTPGTIVTLTFTSTEYGEAGVGLVAAGTKCEVQSGAKISGTNTSAVKISLPLKVWPLITSVATS